MNTEFPKVSVRYEAEVPLEQRNKIIYELQEVINALSNPPIPGKSSESIEFMTDTTSAVEIKFKWRPK